MGLPLERVVVTGYAYATSLGFGDADHEPALRDGRDGSAEITRFDTAGFRTRIGGQCDEQRLDGMLLERWPASKLRHFGVDARLLLWTLASALEDASLDPAALSRALPTVLGTTQEGFLQSERWYEQFLLGSPARARPNLLRHSSAGAQLSAIAELLNLRTEPFFISNACATGISSIGRLFRRIRHGKVPIGIAGGYDCLTRFVHLGFDSLGALTPKRCTPFDGGRSGFFIGDGAGILVLESLASAGKRGARIRGEIVGFGESVDRYHQTRPEPEGKGVAEAIRRCLDSAEGDPGPIDYINAHGTATPANDVAEARGILLALGERGSEIPISSTKALLGHMLGGAGAVEQCICLLAMQRGFLPPQANTQEPDPGCRLRLVQSPEGRPATAMNNSFGFGGANGVLLSRRWEGSA